MIGMSAANATVENIEAAPAAIRYFTLRIGFVLWPREATANATPHIETHGRTISLNL
jgi:hypothetical protein